MLAPQPVSQQYLAFLGRIAPEKRVDRAIRIALGERRVTAIILPNGFTLEELADRDRLLSGFDSTFQAVDRSADLESLLEQVLQHPEKLQQLAAQLAAQTGGASGAAASGAAPATPPAPGTDK